MQHLGAVQVLESAQNLVQKVLAVVVRQRLRRRNNLVQVGVHELGDDVDVLELVDRGGP